MNQYSDSRKPKMDAETWNDAFHSLLKNRGSLNDDDFSKRITQLARRSLQHRFGFHDFVEIQQKLTQVLAKEGKLLAKFACGRLFDVATDNRTIMEAIWETSELSSCRSPGSDGLTLEDWRYGLKDVERARHVKELLRGDDYEPDSLRNCSIPKSSGGKRKLLIPTIEDRIIQRSIKTTIVPYLDSIFLPTSFAYRVRRDRFDALASAMVFANKVNKPWVVAVDIKSAFPSTSKKRLMQTVRKYLHNEKICDLVEQAFSNCSKGMPQGAPLSPVLVNLQLHHLIDKKWSKLEPGRPLLRYADDLLVLCDSRGEAEHYYEMLSKLVTQAGYRLKTNLEQSLFDASEAGDKFEWLGYEVQLRPFKVNLGEQKWFELRRRIEQLRSDHPGNEEEYVDEALFNWAKQALTPMAPSQLDSFQSKVEKLLAEVGLPTEYDPYSFHELHDESKCHWSRAVAFAERNFPSPADADLVVVG